MKIELYPDKAPDTVSNFLAYVDEGYYDGTIFHRVISNFMIQGGGFTADMREKETRDPVKNEADNGLGNERGAIAMARTSDPHSATSQFFINTGSANKFLDHRGKTSQGWGYCAFGRVIDGMGVVDEISGSQTGSRGMHQDVPVEAIVIQSVRRA
jgi:peptidyl-prolyl cis-trans isomerase B (cyclophilin B)